MAQELLNKPRTEGVRESFTYYRKTKPIPVVGDILHAATHVDFAYMVISNVSHTKTNYRYYGYGLRQWFFSTIF